MILSQQLLLLPLKVRSCPWVLLLLLLLCSLFGPA
jgi:hypothetical protein